MEVSDYIVRFETRGKEFISVARLKTVTAAKAKPTHAQAEVGGCESARVTGIGPETSRSSLGQGEIPGNRDGGSLPVLRFKSLG